MNVDNIDQVLMRRLADQLWEVVTDGASAQQVYDLLLLTFDIGPPVFDQPCSVCGLPIPHNNVMQPGLGEPLYHPLCYWKQRCERAESKM